MPEFLRSARSSFLLFPIKKENRQRLYNLLSIFILKLIIGRSDVRKPSATSPLPNEDIALLDCFHDLDTVDKARLVAYAQGLSDKSLKD